MNQKSQPITLPSSLGGSSVADPEWTVKESELLRAYNEAYDFYLHCPENQVAAAKKELDKARSEYINH